MLKTKFDTFPELTTDRLVLRHIKASDARDLYLLRSNELVMKYLDRPKASSEKEMLKKITELDDEFLAGKCVQWAISLKDDPKLIGTICIWNISKLHFRGELGYMLLPEYQKKGLIMEALELVIDFGFHTMLLHSLEGQVTPKNIPSIKVLERNGFKREAYFKENYFFEGKFIDTAVYSLLKSNWNK